MFTGNKTIGERVTISMGGGESISIYFTNFPTSTVSNLSYIGYLLLLSNKNVLNVTNF